MLWALASLLVERGSKVDVAVSMGSAIPRYEDELTDEDRAAMRSAEQVQAGRVIAACAGGHYDTVLDESGHLFQHGAQMGCQALPTAQSLPELRLPQSGPECLFHLHQRAPAP